MSKPSIGRIVHYRLPDRFDGAGERWRPAVVVDTFSDLCNLTVFLDGLTDVSSGKDRVHLVSGGMSLLCDAPIGTVGSAAEGTGVGEWRWPPRV